MLQAKTEDGELVTLASLTRQEIAMMKAKGNFFCPSCNQPVVAKAGTKLIPHFAHASNTRCPSQEGGEGVYHEKGKLLLYQWLKSQQLDVWLETYIPEISQRPDLLLRLKNKTIAIEYQCARIPPELVAKRNRGYARAGIVPIWILGANTLKRYNGHQLKVDQFHLSFIHQFSSDFPRTLYFFCPETQHFILFQDLLFTTLHRASGKMNIRKLQAMNFLDLFHTAYFKQEQLVHIWKREKRAFRLHIPRYAQGREFAWQQWLYVRNTNRQLLPSFIYLPIDSQHMMKTPPWDWQSRICLDIIHPLTVGSTFHYKSCTHILRSQMHKPSFFPLIKSAANPITQYLQMLEQLHIIHKQSPTTFRKQMPIHFYEHLEEAMDGDERLMRQLRKKHDLFIIRHTN